MSHDLMVFAADIAPKERKAFLAWYDDQSEWNEDHTYDNPSVSTPKLKAWFMEMIKGYPPMDGPFSKDDLPDDELSLTDYSIGRHVIYAAFAWSAGDEAYQAMFSLAAKHGLGFFNASSEKAEVWFPDNKGGLTLLHSD